MTIPIPTTSLLGLAYIIAAYFLYVSLSSILSSRQNTAKARQRKCQDPPELKSRYPFGIDLLLRLHSADKAKLFPVDLIQRFVDVGATTYKYTLPGVQNLMKALNLSLTSGNWMESVDLGVLFFRLTLDSATEFLFETSVDSQLDVFPGHGMLHSEAGAPNSSGFATALYWIFSPNSFMKNCKICHDFVDDFVRLALAKNPWEKQQRLAGAAEKYFCLDALATQTRDPVELRTQALSLLLAGRDTTASHLSWLFLRLSQDPVRYKKLRDIIIGEFGTYDKPSGITFSQLKDCRYLQPCNNEVLRLHPAVPVNARTANKDTSIPRGGGQDGLSPIFIPKRMAVEYSVHAMRYRADIWGPDVERFKPERWEGRKLGWEYLPFNGGPRICLGQQFSLTAASYVIVRLLQRFDQMEYLGKDPVIRHNLALTNSPADPVEIRMHAA
ncbi:Cytochrome P450 [Lachnellula subtilissima]|uniref:Cytochrome P450 n=1 Tax=Lachnellula subtilissima TaxID=602034 RepID=A0A8H8RAG7_9HELO|nr:Cytochrome P450 [Lachnellula subtilissima]